MHQPDYRDHIRDEFLHPWVYLHGIKDYVDMVAYLEAMPGAKAVFNFSPILLEQLDIYEQQIINCLENHEPVRDPVLAALDMPVFPADPEHRLALVRACLRANRERLIERFAPYKRLVQIAELVLHDTAHSAYLSNQYLADLVTWYHLAWLGETVRHSDERVRQLTEQESGFTLHQRRSLLHVIAELLSSLRKRYRKLAVEGRIELAMSPYAHPIMPLLLKFEEARDALPEIRLPVLSEYPGGEDRLRWQIQHGLSVFEDYFGLHPRGCWPSEGGVSMDTLACISRAGFQWAATGEGVIRNSLEASANDERDNPGPEQNSIFSSFRVNNIDLHLFGRDDTLSDLIGFTYADWHADDAVNDLVHRLQEIAAADHGGGTPLVSIIMDGENAWEYYPENGYYFLSALYKRLVEHPDLDLVTYREVMEQAPVCHIDRVVSGSWVYGTFSTWIGDADKNRAWDILGDAKRVYDEITADRQPDPPLRLQIDKQLAVCEGSDWFWWFGDYNPAATVSDFEHLFRIHLANLYQMLQQEPPQYLSQVLAHGSGMPRLGGVIRPGKENPE